MADGRVVDKTMKMLLALMLEGRTSSMNALKLQTNEMNELLSEKLPHVILYGSFRCRGSRADSINIC